jgi:hypothetical protein
VESLPSSVDFEPLRTLHPVQSYASSRKSSVCLQTPQGQLNGGACLPVVSTDSARVAIATGSFLVEGEARITSRVRLSF